MKPLRECPVCRGIGYLIEKGNGVTEGNPEGLRWYRVRCWKCRGAGLVRE